MMWLPAAASCSRVTSMCGIGNPSSSSYSSSIIPSSLLPLFLSPPPPPHQMRRFGGGVSASHNSTPPSSSSADIAIPTTTPSRWKPMCLYYTQNRCTKMDDVTHLHTFNHTFSDQLTFSPPAVHLKHLAPQNFDFFLVLDLEGKVEILEFPLLLIDAKTMELVHFFHRFVRPTVMSERRINQYIRGKYGNFGVDRVWHDTAIPFQEVIQQFEDWMTHHHLWTRELGGRLNKAAFITCGNWDLKTKVPQQCKVSRMKLPSYFMEWINIKDVYLNFYKRRATGMLTMMRELQMPLVGSHHLGIDDTKNITRVLQRMFIDGAVLQITARRHNDSPESVDFLYKNRI